ncbi:polyprenol monophosphomannose synthase [Nocardioides sp. AN3]
MIVVPTYNESASVAALLEEIATVRSRAAGASIDVLVVDDSSPDGTGDVIRRHPAFGEWLRLLTRGSKNGLGAAYRAGFSVAVEDGYDAIVQMDADGSHPASEVPAMLHLLDDHDVVIGSRYVPGGATVNWPVERRMLSGAANAYARSMLRLTTRDATSGFRAWRRSSLAAAHVLDSTSTGYGFQVENTWRSERAGLRVAEHPITFTERTAGASKMTTDVAREAAVRILRWRLGELRAGRAAPVPAPGDVPRDVRRDPQREPAAHE